MRDLLHCGNDATPLNHMDVLLSCLHRLNCFYYGNAIEEAVKWLDFDTFSVI